MKVSTKDKTFEILDSLLSLVVSKNNKCYLPSQYDNFVIKEYLGRGIKGDKICGLILKISDEGQDKYIEINATVKKDNNYTNFKPASECVKKTTKKENIKKIKDFETNDYDNKGLPQVSAIANKIFETDNL